MAAEFLSVQDYKNVLRWADMIAAASGGETRAHGQSPQRRGWPITRAPCVTSVAGPNGDA